MIEVDSIYLDLKHVEFMQCFDQSGKVFLEIGMVSGKMFYLDGDLKKVKDIMDRILKEKGVQ
jgi:hypothetical protein